jgi:hypothetical protein
LVNTNANNTWTVTVINDTAFSLNRSTGNGCGGATGTFTRDDTAELNTWIADHHTSGGVIRLINCSIQQGQVQLGFHRPFNHVRIEIDGVLHFTQQNAGLEHSGNIALVGISGGDPSIAGNFGSAASIQYVPQAFPSGSTARLGAPLSSSYMRINTGSVSNVDVGSVLTISGAPSPYTDNNGDWRIVAYHVDELEEVVIRAVTDDGRIITPDPNNSHVTWTIGSRSGDTQVLNVQKVLPVTGLNLMSADPANAKGQWEDVGFSGSWKHHLALSGHPTNPDCCGVFRIFGAQDAGTAYIYHKTLTEGFNFNGTMTPPVWTPDSVNLTWTEIVSLIRGQGNASTEWRNLVVLYWPGITFLIDGGWDISGNYKMDHISAAGGSGIGSIPFVSDTSFENWESNCAFSTAQGAPLSYLSSSVVSPINASIWFDVTGGGFEGSAFSALHHFRKLSIAGGGIAFTCRAPIGFNQQGGYRFEGLGFENGLSPGVFNIETRETSVTIWQVQGSFSADTASPTAGYLVWMPYPVPNALAATFDHSMLPDTNFHPGAAVDRLSFTGTSIIDQPDQVLSGDPVGGNPNALAMREYLWNQDGRLDATLLDSAAQGSPSINPFPMANFPWDPFDADHPWTSLDTYPGPGVLQIDRVRGPRGLLTAARLTALGPNALINLRYPTANSAYDAPLQVGDIVVVGAWLRSPNPAKGAVSARVILATSAHMDNSPTVSTLFSNHDEYITRAGGGWRYWMTMGKVTRASIGTVNFLLVGAEDGRPIEIDELFLCVIPASAGIPEDEVIRIFRRARYMRPRNPVGVSCIGKYESYGIAHDLQMGRDATSVPLDPAWKTGQSMDVHTLRADGHRVVRTAPALAASIIPDTVQGYTLESLANEVQRLTNLVKFHGLAKTQHNDPRYIFQRLLWFVRGQDESGNPAYGDAGDGTALSWLDLTGQNVIQMVNTTGDGTQRPTIRLAQVNGRTFLEGDGVAKFFRGGSPTLGNLDKLTVFGILQNEPSWNAQDFQSIVARGLPGGAESPNCWIIYSRPPNFERNQLIAAFHGTELGGSPGAISRSAIGQNMYDGNAHRFMWIRDNTQSPDTGFMYVNDMVSPIIPQTFVGQIADVTNPIALFGNFQGGTIADFAHTRLGEVGIILGTPSQEELAEYAAYVGEYYGI